MEQQTMTEPSEHREYGPCMRSVVADGLLAAVVFFGIAAAFVLVPDEPDRRHYVIAALPALLGLLMVPLMVLYARARRYVLTETGVRCCSGVFAKHELDVPFRSIQAVSVRQGLVQRMFGCGSVRISAQGVTNPVLIMYKDMSSLCLRSLTEFREVAAAVRAGMSQRE